MHIYGEVYIGPDGLPHGRHPRDHRFLFPGGDRAAPEVAVQRAGHVVDVELDRVEPSFEGLLRDIDVLPLQILGEQAAVRGVMGGGVHRARVAVGVEADALAEGAPEETVDRDVLKFAGEVPERDLDAAYGGDHRARLPAGEDVPAP